MKIIFRFIVVFTAVMLLSGLLLNGQVNTEKFRSEGDENKLEFKVGLSMALHKGNIDLLKVDADLNVNYKKNNSYLFLVGNLNYGEKNDAAYISKGFAHLRGIQRLSKRLMVEAFVQQEFNKFIKLEGRTLLGAGIRLLLFKSVKDDANFSASLGAGGMWETESFKEADGVVLKEDQSLFKSTNYLSLNYTINKNTQLDNVTYLQFNLGGEKSTRINSDLIFAVKLSKSLSYKAKLHYRHDNNPPLTVKKDDMQLTNGLTLSF
ncbi:MAG: DUF481 domain-containing protein [bacterium]|nr:DUF481 domain-containing protein [bacterium]